MQNHPRRFEPDPRDRSLRVGAIGLGAGTIAAYGEPGDYIRFYEINPAVTEIATDENGYFTYLRDSRARIEVVPGDARLSMERELANGNPQAFDVLVLDAFAGDAIPVHLLTIEAFAIYLRELNADGVIAIHVTNRYLDLRPVIRENSRSLWIERRASASVRRLAGQTQRLDNSCAQQFSPRPCRVDEQVASRWTRVEARATLDRRLQQSVSDLEVIGDAESEKQSRRLSRGFARKSALPGNAAPTPAHWRQKCSP